MVPFERDLNSVGRMDIIAELDQNFNSHRRVALAGIGGIGKSQIAIEYCYRFRDKYHDASIFWVHVGTISKFKQGYEAIANNLGLVGKDNPKANTLQLVADWFNNEDNGRWLMILDNVDDQSVFESDSKNSEQSMPLIRYLPHSQTGSIIITTRDRRVGERLTFREKPLLVSLFDRHMAKTLLRSKLDKNIEWIEEDADKLVETLEFLPLAVTQAAAFITENSITAKKYTDILRASDSGLTNLLNQDLIDLRRDFDASSSIIRTWQVSFDQIRMQNPRAAKLLSLMAVLDRQGIPKTLLCRDNEDQIDIITALGTLQAFSLISSNKAGETFRMHRLVQLSTLKWLEMQNEKLIWQNEALRLLSANFPSGKFETWEICALYFPHAMIVIDRLRLGLDHVNELSLLLDTSFYLTESQWQDDLAEKLVRQALELYEKAYGDEHFDTLRSMRLLGEILIFRGKYNDAEELLQKSLILSKKTFGEKHGFTLSSVKVLTSVLIHQGKNEQAKEMLEQNMKLQSGVMGEEHENTLASMETLAETYFQLHQFNEAEELHVQALEKRKKVLGVEHPDTLTSMSCLARTYYALNRLDEAEELQVQTLEKREKVLGAEHPETLLSMSSLVETYFALNRLDEAEELQVQVLEKIKKVLGAGHPDALLSMANLA
ncbi:hypothetical protein MMC29_003151 [Sticta canariensis]|nr:hypothetical protein [Sticta canariensis]